MKIDLKKKLKSIDYKYVFKYISLLLITSVLLFILFVSIPQTEKVLPTRFDVNLQDQSLKSYTLTSDISFTESQKASKEKLIYIARNVLYKRLDKYGVEFVQINYINKDDLNGTFEIKIHTTKSVTDIENIVRAQGKIKLVVKKDEANFENSDDPYAQFLPTNYDETYLNRSYFRTVYVTQLDTVAGDKAYFGLFKPWVWNISKLDKFYSENGGKSGGVDLDGFVTPFTIPVPADQSAGNPKPILSVAVGTDENSAKISTILYNNGEIPGTYTYKDKIENKNELVKINKYMLYYLSSGLALLSVTIGYFKFRKDSFDYLLSIFIVYGLLLTYYKFTVEPVISLSLLVAVPIGYLFHFVIFKNMNKYIVSVSIGLILLLHILSNTYTAIFTPTLLYLFISAPISIYVAKKYIQLFKSTLL